jgi:NAD(P)H-hydrate epimerase
VAGLALEPMTLACPDLDGGLAPAAADVLLQRAKRTAVVALGPGCGRADGTADLVRLIVPQITAPLVLDADGLHAVGTDLGLLRSREAPTVITPHAGEAARLLGVTTAEIAAHRLASARALAEKTGAVCVLKGGDTIIAAPDGRLAVRDGDDPRLATAGTGDVLCGMIAGLLARGIPAFEAAAAGAAAHLAAAQSTRAGAALVASDLIDHLPLGG